MYRIVASASPSHFEAHVGLFRLLTLVYQIDVQDEINMQVGKFLKNIKRAGQNRSAGGKFSGKSINVQGENFLGNQ